jgi:hypothetical protein
MTKKWEANSLAYCLFKKAFDEILSDFSGVINPPAETVSAGL